MQSLGQIGRVSGFVGTPRWMATSSSDKDRSGHLLLVERQKKSELSNNQEIFKAVRDEKRTLPSLKRDGEDVPDGYDDLMKRCCKYKANQRPLIGG